MLERIKVEAPVFKQLEAAVGAKDEDEMRDAVSEAQKIEFDHKLVGEAEDMLKNMAQVRCP